MIIFFWHWSNEIKSSYWSKALKETKYHFIKTRTKKSMDMQKERKKDREREIERKRDREKERESKRRKERARERKRKNDM